MHERQRSAGLEDPRGRQQIGRIGRLELFEAREPRRLEQVALLENRQRPREPARMLRQPTEPETNRATDRLVQRFRCLPRSTPPRAHARGTASRA